MLKQNYRQVISSYTLSCPNVAVSTLKNIKVYV